MSYADRMLEVEAQLDERIGRTPTQIRKAIFQKRERDGHLNVLAILALTCGFERLALYLGAPTEAAITEYLAVLKREGYATETGGQPRCHLKLHHRHYIRIERRDDVPGDRGQVTV